ncbi:hypothetical protein DFH09DRAFT_1082363 [Mycena vulgaris]|nr:hypothetical protein DFH09DRAFT_1082363 [Mycena vulgaris]
MQFSKLLAIATALAMGVSYLHPPNTAAAEDNVALKRAVSCFSDGPTTWRTNAVPPFRQIPGGLTGIIVLDFMVYFEHSMYINIRKRVVLLDTSLSSHDRFYTPPVWKKKTTPSGEEWDAWIRSKFGHSELKRFCCSGEVQKDWWLGVRISVFKQQKLETARIKVHHVVPTTPRNPANKSAAESSFSGFACTTSTPTVSLLCHDKTRIQHAAQPLFNCLAIHLSFRKVDLPIPGPLQASSNISSVLYQID